MIFTIPTANGTIIESINCNFALFVSNTVFIIAVDLEIDASIPNIAPKKPVIIEEKLSTSPKKSFIFNFTKQLVKRNTNYHLHICLFFLTNR